MPPFLALKLTETFVILENYSYNEIETLLFYNKFLGSLLSIKKLVDF